MNGEEDISDQNQSIYTKSVLLSMMMLTLKQVASKAKVITGGIKEDFIEQISKKGEMTNPWTERYLLKEYKVWLHMWLSSPRKIGQTLHLMINKAKDRVSWA